MILLNYQKKILLIIFESKTIITSSYIIFNEGQENFSILLKIQCKNFQLNTKIISPINDKEWWTYDTRARDDKNENLVDTRRIYNF